MIKILQLLYRIQRNHQRSVSVSEYTKYYIALVFSMFLWGASWVSIKVLVSISPPMTIGFLRYGLATLLFIPLLKSRGRSLRALVSQGTRWSLLAAGFVGIFGFMVFSLIGTGLTTASQASIIAGLNPVTVSFFAHVMNKERLVRTWQYLGFLLSFLGIAFVIGVQALLDFNLAYLVGNFLLIFSMLMWGLYSSIGKTLMNTMSPDEVTAGSIFFGLIFFGVATLPEIPSWQSVLLLSDFWINIAFLGGLSSFIGFMFYFESIKRIGATRTGGFISLVPLFGTTTAILLLQEPIYGTFIIGLVFVVIGILVINAPTGRAKDDEKMISPV